MYALAADKRKGNKQAAAELDALTAKMKLERAARAGRCARRGCLRQTQTSARRGRLIGRAARTGRTTRPAEWGWAPAHRAKTSERPSRSRGGDPEWMARALGRTF